MTRAILGAMKVFSYGSNMLTERLTAKNRAPGAVRIDTGFVRGRALRFHKRSVDLSGKCDMFPTGVATDLVWGIVFEVPPADIGPLRKAEGVGNGYDELPVVVEFSDGRMERITAFIAQAKFIAASLRPYTWYRDLVIAGAEEHGLRADYLAMLRAVSASEDPDPKRETRLEAEAVLRPCRDRQPHRS